MTYCSDPMSEWQVEIGGKPQRIAAERLPNGKIVVRANGRIVGPAQPLDKVDCRFALAGEQCCVWGAENSLQFEHFAVEPAPAPMPAKIEVPASRRLVAVVGLGALLFLVSSCFAAATGRIEEKIRADEAPAWTGMTQPGDAKEFEIFGVMR